MKIYITYQHGHYGKPLAFRTMESLKNYYEPRIQKGIGLKDSKIWCEIANQSELRVFVANKYTNDVEEWPDWEPSIDVVELID